MALFPLAKPLEGMSLTTTACHLYTQSLLNVLPVSISFALILHLIQNGAQYLPDAWKSLTLSISMFLGVLTLPLLSGFIIVIDRVSKGHPVKLKDDLLEILQRFPSLMATLVSMLLIPAIIFAIAVGIQLYLLGTHAAPVIIIVFRVMIGLVIFAAFTPKLFSPFLVFTHSLDSNSALEMSELLVKGSFVKTFLYGLYGLVFFGLLLTLSTWLPYLVPSTKEISVPLLQSIGQILVAILGSWSFALWMTLLADAQCRKKEALKSF